MKREEKQKQAEELRRTLERARTIVLTGFEGLTVAQDVELRRKIAEAGARYKVVKNSLMERAAAGTQVEPLARKLRGTTSVAYTEGDPVALARALTAYAKDNPALVFRAGMVEGRLISLADLANLATLPSREHLLARVSFLLKAPAQRLASSVSGIARSLAYVIGQGVEQKKFAAGAGS